MTETKISPKTVKEIRAERKINLQQLAEMTNIPLRVLQMIDQRHYRASKEQVQSLADALGVSTDELDIGLPQTFPGTWGSGGTYS
ncbi:MAG: helix-turn-helix transcriptional regulator [Candidatus Poribacteria bacterium]|nr:helix-turn-helix transcriptional regulator [Candidatus Poribacteria bacterium]